MPVQDPEPVYRLLQVVALALPAVAIYMNVLVELYRDKATVKGMSSGLVTGWNSLFPIVAHQEMDFTLAQWGMLGLLFSGICLLTTLILGCPLLFTAGEIFLLLAFLSLSISVLYTTFPAAREKIRGLVGYYEPNEKDGL